MPCFQTGIPSHFLNTSAEAGAGSQRRGCFISALERCLREPQRHTFPSCTTITSTPFSFYSSAGFHPCPMGMAAGLTRNAACYCSCPSPKGRFLQPATPSPRRSQRSCALGIRYIYTSYCVIASEAPRKGKLLKERV